MVPHKETFTHEASHQGGGNEESKKGLCNLVNVKDNTLCSCQSSMGLKTQGVIIFSGTTQRNFYLGGLPLRGM